MIKRFLAKLFPPKVMWLQSMIVLGIKREGKMYLHISRCGKDGVVDRKIFLVEHLVDENFEVTDQTLEQEKRFFTLDLP